MKKCPLCNEMSGDDNLFCVNDGVTLVPAFEVSQSRMVISLENNPPAPELPTRFVSPPKPPTGIPKDNSKFLYSVIGALTTIILLMGIGFIFLRNINDGEIVAQVKPNDKETTQISNQPEKSKSENNTTNFSSTNQNAAQPVSNTANSKEKFAPKPNQNSNMSWSGNTGANWSSNTNSSGNNFPMARNFNRTYRGTADNDGITMQLKRSGSSLSGRVLSRRSATEISVSGNIDGDGYFEMSEYSDIGVTTGIYQGRINTDGTLTGTWTKPDGSKPRPVYLRAN